MEFALWSAIVGALLIFMALAGSMLARLPLSTSMVYVGVGVALSPLAFDLARPDALTDAVALERLAEVVVLVSLFTSGLKMRAGLHDRRWLPPLRLAVISMLATVAAITAAGVGLLGLPLGAALLLGGILAPTDPVLASEVQLGNPQDRDQLRYALTGEGGLNDGTAFPFVMLGLGLLGLHDIGTFGWRWFAIDVVWATAVGIGIGAGLGLCTARLVLYLRRTHKEAVGYDNFLALGLITLAYGAALLLHAYGFLAVFAAGVALRRVEHSGETAPANPAGASPEKGSTELVARAQASADGAPADALATHPKHASAFMAHAVLSFNEQLDRTGEVVAVIAIGMVLWAVPWQHAVWWFVPLMLLVIRPLSVALGLAGSRTSTSQRRLIGWFGIRGIGSLYYLMYAVNHGIDAALAATLVAIVLSVVVASIVVHGVSVTPLMARYRHRSDDVATDSTRPP